MIKLQFEEHEWPGKKETSLCGCVQEVCTQIKNAVGRTDAYASRQNVASPDVTKASHSCVMAAVAVICQLHHECKYGSTHCGYLGHKVGSGLS